MLALDDFIALVRDELGLAVTAADAQESLDRIEGWDSVHLLWLLTLIEQRTGRAVPLADLMEADSLGEMYSLVTA
ncbi:MAG TPA: acyl carrier protein [Actinocrinis sp.]|jgi:acyl carrier protein